MVGNSEARGSLRAENRIKRRFARFKDKKHLVTRDPLMAELALAQIDATLSVSHAIQELGEHLDRAELAVTNVRPAPFDSKSVTEAKIERMQYDIRWLQDQNSGLSALVRQEIDKIIRPTPVPETLTVPPWWAFWRGW